MERYRSQERILQALAESLPEDSKRLVLNRMASLEANFEYLYREKKHKFAKIEKAGWSPERIAVVVVLNSFYQEVIAPLQSSSRASRVSPLEDTPIAYGKLMRFNSEWSNAINEAFVDFSNLASSAGIYDSVLWAQRAEDIIFQIESNVYVSD